MNSVSKISIEALIDRYDVLLFDAFGVLVNGVGALPGAVDLIDQLNRSGKRYYILTNDASRLPVTSAVRFQGLGLDINPERIITPGRLIKKYFAVHNLANAQCVVMGPVDSRTFVRHAGGKVVAPDSAFDVLVIADESGFPFLETIDAVLSGLFNAIDHRREIHLILPNPDLIYPRNNHGFGVGSGSIALIFEAALRIRYPHRSDLKFIPLGKPEPGLFNEAFHRCGSKNMVMIGDQIETDIRGACAFGIDSALFGSPLTDAYLTTLPNDSRPTYQLDSF